MWVLYSLVTSHTACEDFTGDSGHGWGLEAWPVKLLLSDIVVVQLIVVCEKVKS